MGPHLFLGRMAIPLYKITYKITPFLCQPVTYYPGYTYYEGSQETQFHKIVAVYD
jgi:hypothetical protein